MKKLSKEQLQDLAAITKNRKAASNIIKEASKIKEQHDWKLTMFGEDYTFKTYIIEVPYINIDIDSLIERIKKT